MLSFKQYIIEVTATKPFRLTRAEKDKAKQVMANIAKQVMARQKKKPVKRNSGINWASMEGDHLTAWWHPTKPPHIFTWVFGKRHHMNEIVNFPSVFGVTQQQIRKGVEDYTENNGMSRTSPNWESQVLENLRRFKVGEVDSANAIAKLAYEKGWVQVRKKGMVRMEGEFGGSRKSMKALFREILDLLDSATGPRPEQFNISLFFPGENISLGRIKSREDIEKLINS